MFYAGSQAAHSSCEKFRVAFGVTSISGRSIEGCMSVRSSHSRSHKCCCERMVMLPFSFWCEVGEPSASHF